MDCLILKKNMTTIFMDYKYLNIICFVFCFIAHTFIFNGILKEWTLIVPLFPVKEPIH